MIRFDKGEFVSESGSPFAPVYKPKVLPNGNIELVESGFENLDEYIQSFAESCDINVILNRVANGELELLNQRNGIFGDFTGMPKTYAEALQLHIDSNRLFASLPADVRKKFDNDENKFFASAGSEDWFDKVHEVMPDDVKEIFEKFEKINEVAQNKTVEVKEGTEE